MAYTKNRVCPVERAGRLDSGIRRWFQNPQKILSPYIKEGMTVLDLGCGPGFFTMDIARMVGKSGRVIASDLQEGMLEKTGSKIHGTELEERIALHQCKENKIGVSDKVDFILAFYMVHEIPDKKALFNELETIIKPSGQVLIVEPKFHVSEKAFKETIGIAGSAGFEPAQGPKVFFSRAVILKKADKPLHQK
ncbi:MAG TPA: methyltransferase domain-containing protein [Smithella sp.]|nr:methyltransferase domain-containing protein [Smithella sp.]